MKYFLLFLFFIIFNCKERISEKKEEKIEFEQKEDIKEEQIEIEDKNNIEEKDFYELEDKKFLDETEEIDKFKEIEIEEDKFLDEEKDIIEIEEKEVYDGDTVEDSEENGEICKEVETKILNEFCPSLLHQLNDFFPFYTPEYKECFKFVNEQIIDNEEKYEKLISCASMAKNEINYKPDFSKETLYFVDTIGGREEIIVHKCKDNVVIKELIYDLTSDPEISFVDCFEDVLCYYLLPSYGALISIPLQLKNFKTKFPFEYLEYDVCEACYYFDWVLKVDADDKETSAFVPYPDGTLLCVVKMEYLL